MEEKDADYRSGTVPANFPRGTYAIQRNLSRFDDGRGGRGATLGAIRGSGTCSGVT
jgi:hypothetical protein